MNAPTLEYGTRMGARLTLVFRRMQVDLDRLGRELRRVFAALLRPPPTTRHEQAAQRRLATQQRITERRAARRKRRTRA